MWVWSLLVGRNQRGKQEKEAQILDVHVTHNLDRVTDGSAKFRAETRISAHHSAN